MGIRFDRVLEGLDGPFELVTTAVVPPGEITGPSHVAGYLFRHHVNNAFIALNRLLAGGEDVYWLRDRVAGASSQAREGPGRDENGAMYVAARPSTLPLLEKAAAELGVSFVGVATAPIGEALRIRPTRIALWDQYGGSPASGWTRWLLERFQFPFERVYVQTLNGGNLASRYDVIILPEDAVPVSRSRRDDGTGIGNVPEEYRATIGSMTWDHTVPQLKQFVENGGTLLLVGGATEIARRMGAPLKDALVVKDGDEERPLRLSEYYIPGSILRVSVNNTVPLGYGLDSEVDVFFDNSPVFRVEGAAGQRVAWFSGATPLRSGWAWGQEHLDGGVAIADVRIGQGHVAVFGPPITFRAQSHGTFKFLFNGIFYGKAVSVGNVPR
jgi:hypothetical protein